MRTGESAITLKTPITSWLATREPGHSSSGCANWDPSACMPRFGEPARQAATLNTNTRYLYKSVIEYADRYAACFDDAIASLATRGFALAAFYLDLVFDENHALQFTDTLDRALQEI